MKNITAKQESLSNWREEMTEGKKKGLDGKACWDGYSLKGTKKKGGKTVDNCVKVDEAKVDDVKYGKGKGWDQPEGKSMTSYKARHSYLKRNPANVRSDRNERHSAVDVVFHGHDKVERDRKKEHFKSRGKKKVRGAKNEEFTREDVQSTVKKVLDRGSEFVEKNPVGKVLGAIVAPVNNNKGKNYPTKAENEKNIQKNQVKEENKKINPTNWFKGDKDSIVKDSIEVDKGNTEVLDKYHQFEIDPKKSKNLLDKNPGAKQKKQDLLDRDPNKPKATPAAKTVNAEEFIPLNVYATAVNYFYEQGINEDGLDLIIEEIGVETFTDFILDLPEQLNEERSAKKAPKRDYEKVKASVYKKDAARKEKGTGEYSKTKAAKDKYGDEEAPEGAPEKKVATKKKVKKSVAKAKTKQSSEPASKKGLGDRIKSAYKEGVKRHRKATQGARVFGKGFASGAKKAVKFAKDVHQAVNEEEDKDWYKKPDGVNKKTGETSSEMDRQHSEKGNRADKALRVYRNIRKVADTFTGNKDGAFNRANNPQGIERLATGLTDKLTKNKTDYDRKGNGVKEEIQGGVSVETYTKDTKFMEIETLDVITAEPLRSDWRGDLKEVAVDKRITTTKGEFGKDGFEMNVRQMSDKEMNDKLPTIGGVKLEMDQDGNLPNLGRFVQDTARTQANKFADSGIIDNNKTVGTAMGLKAGMDKAMTGDDFKQLAKDGTKDLAFNINKEIKGTTANRVQGVADSINQSTSNLKGKLSTSSGAITNSYSWRDELYLGERLGGKGYKSYTSLTGEKVSGDWEDSDRGGGHKWQKRVNKPVKKKSPTYLAHVKNKDKK